MYKKKKHNFLQVGLLQLLLAGIAGVSLNSFSAEHEIAQDSFIVKVFVNHRDAVNKFANIPARGKTQILVLTDDTTGRVTSIVKRTTGQFKVCVHEHEVDFEFSSVVRLLETGQIELQVWFENSSPHRNIRVPVAPSPNAVHDAGLLHFWNHLVPSRDLAVKVVIRQAGISTIIKVNDRQEVFFQPVRAGEINSIRRQALGMEFITAVLSPNPPDFVERIDLVHSLEHFFTLSRISPEKERPFGESESGVTYTYPVYIGMPSGGVSEDKPIYNRYSVTQSDSFIFGTASIQVHRISGENENPEPVAVNIHHPAALVKLITANTPTLAEVAERTHFLNLNDVRAFRGVYDLLSRESLLEVGELPLPIPSQSDFVVEDQIEATPPVSFQPGSVIEEKRVAAVSSGTGTVLSGSDIPFATLMSIASGGIDTGGGYIVDFNMPLPPELIRRRSVPRLPIFVDVLEKGKSLIPVGNAMSPMVPAFPVPIGATGGDGTVQNPRRPREPGEGMGFGFFQDEEKKEQSGWY